MIPTGYVRDAVVVGLAVSIFGAAFGVLATTNDLSVAKTMAFSLLVFTGASQFAAVSVISAGGSETTAFGSALLLAARNSFYGPALARHLGANIARRILGAQLIIDESTALSVAQAEPKDRGPAFWAGGISVFVFWNLGTLAGALGGDAIGDPGALGLDAAFPAGFISLAAPALRQRRGLAAAVAGAIIALVATPFVRPGVPILVAAVGAVVALAVPPGADR